MTDVVLQMAVLMLCGVAWRIIRPGGLDADRTRQALAGAVYYVLLPGLVLDVLTRYPLGSQTLRIALFGVVLIVGGTALGWLVCRWLPLSRPQHGAALLAVAFPNVTFLGLPVLEEAFGPWARSVAIQIDLFAGMPLVFTLAIALARHYGHADGPERGVWRSLVAIPALWAAAAAVLSTACQMTWPLWFAGALSRMSATVAPLMLFSLGLGLRLDALRTRSLLLTLPVLALRLLLLPALAWPLGLALDFQGDTWRALVLEAAMPSMVVGIVLCDRFGLDSGFYAVLVTLGTLLSLATLPLWWTLFQRLA